MRLWGEKVIVNLVWNTAAQRVRQTRFKQAQNYIDKKAVDYMMPYVPVARPFWHNAGKLRDSARIAEPGRIEFTAPFARHDYNAVVNHRHGGNPNAQRRWFEYMKAKDGQKILMGARRIVGK